MNYILVLVLMTLGLGCVNGDFVRSYELNQFKVVALVADKPEVNIGETVTVTPFVSDVTGNGRAITFSADACLDPGVGFGATPSCNGSSSRVEIAADSALTGLTAPYYTGPSTATITIKIPSTGIFDQIPADRQFNGVSYLLVVEFRSNGVSLEKTFRRIVVSTRPIKNQNPAFQNPAITRNGSDLTTLSAEARIAGEAVSSSTELFEEIRNGSSTTQTEKLLVYWFASQGEFNFSSTNPGEETTWKPNENNSLPFTLLAVLRDGRGGISIIQKNF